MPGKSYKKFSLMIFCCRRFAFTRAVLLSEETSFPRFGSSGRNRTTWTCSFALGSIIEERTVDTGSRLKKISHSPSCQDGLKVKWFEKENAMLFGKRIKKLSSLILLARKLQTIIMTACSYVCLKMLAYSRALLHMMCHCKSHNNCW